MSMDPWAVEEFGGAKLGDGRLTQRLIQVASAFADRPTASIPGACSGWAETQATYRFFDQASEKKQGLGWEDVLTPHMECTLARMHSHRVVLCLQDTTELDFNGQSIQGLGPLSYETQRGLYLHPTYAVTPEREEWKGTYILAKKAPPSTPPTLREMIRSIAMLGGFLGRKGDGEPGVKTLWLGFVRLRDFVTGVEHMRAVYAKSVVCKVMG
jgi:hypothetical protein